MTGPPGEWHYLCLSDECDNRIDVPPVPNPVHCGICGSEMAVFAIEEGK